MPQNSNRRPGRIAKVNVHELHFAFDIVLGENTTVAGNAVQSSERTRMMPDSSIGSISDTRSCRLMIRSAAAFALA